MKRKQITVAHEGVGRGEEPVPTEIIAESIVTIAKGMKAIKASRLNERAILVLLRDATSLSMSEIKRVLGALEELEALFLKKKVQGGG